MNATPAQSTAGAGPADPYAARPWLHEYEPGVPTEIDLQGYASVADIIEKSCHKFSEKVAFENLIGGKFRATLTYAELDRLSRDFAAYLQGVLGLKKGDRVAVMLPNLIQYPVAICGILRAGCVVVNVNPLYTPRELEHQLKDADAQAIVVFENVASTLQQVMGKVGLRKVITTQVGDMLGLPKSWLVNFIVKHRKKMVPAWDIDDTIDFRSTLIEGKAQAFERPNIGLEDVAFLQYTGGTTGLSKGATLTHANIVSNMLQSKGWISRHIREGQEVIVTPLPLYHIFALTANCLVFLSAGARNVLITDPRDIPALVAELAASKFTAFTGVNTLFNGLLHNAEFAKIDFSGLQMTLGGGMAVQQAVAEKWRQVTGKPLSEAYGLSETSPGVCINPLHKPEWNGTIGLPIVGTDVSLRDDDGHPVPLGSPGELCVKGPQVMRGYWNKPAENAKSFTADGYFRTGDIATMDARGYFKIVDRKKDMILVSGFNVYPNEIEDVFARHPKVMEVAAIGVPDDKSGEAVKVFVVKKDASLTLDELKAWGKQQLTGYKVPKLYEFRESLPKSNVGKILRKDLRDAK